MSRSADRLAGIRAYAERGVRVPVEDILYLVAEIERLAHERDELAHDLQNHEMGGCDV